MQFNSIIKEALPRSKLGQLRWMLEVICATGSRHFGFMGPYSVRCRSVPTLHSSVINVFRYVFLGKPAVDLQLGQTSLPLMAAFFTTMSLSGTGALPIVTSLNASTQAIEWILTLLQFVT